MSANIGYFHSVTIERFVASTGLPLEPVDKNVGGQHIRTGLAAGKMKRIVQFV
jgi:hypothetical protein